MAEGGDCYRSTPLSLARPIDGQTKRHIMFEGNGMKSRIVLCFCLLLAVETVSGNDYPPNTFFYAVEYLKPSPGAGDLSTINIIVNAPIDAEAADRLLREELLRAITLFPPKGNVMAFAWHQPDPRSDPEQAIYLPDGSHFLIYSSASGKMQTESEFSADNVKSPTPGKEINVQVTLNTEKRRDGRARINGQTNLPDKMTLTLSLRGLGFGYGAQSTVTVLRGGFSTDWFSDKGNALPRGKYEVSITSPLPTVQPEEVRSIIGKDGENLVGPIKTYMGQKMIQITMEKDI